MKTLLVIQCTPRNENSNTMPLAEHFITSLQSSGPSWNIDKLNLWDESFPEMNGEILTAKYAFFEGQPLNDEQAHGWSQVRQHLERFSRADAVVVVMPIWNLNVPYVLKHYIDVITQPGLCFSWSQETGYQSLLQNKTALVLSSSGQGFHPGSGNENDDFGLNYIERWLVTFMNCHVQKIASAPTEADESRVLTAKRQAYDQASLLAKNFK
ncbi:FMN-dependent NADH-azoreductase [Neptunomonas japonica]|uniref:FMN-dependent NADH-azoreductase n=1 Tax=Neptunomonas japonica TaxID=417574 RepID=UPI000A0105B7|nr:NAD(P)H-dependent oxidoreductase [Neptunomonas japonica]